MGYVIDRLLHLSWLDDLTIMTVDVDLIANRRLMHNPLNIGILRTGGSSVMDGHRWGRDYNVRLRLMNHIRLIHIAGSILLVDIAGCVLILLISCAFSGLIIGRSVASVVHFVLTLLGLGVLSLLFVHEDRLKTIRYSDTV